MLRFKKSDRHSLSYNHWYRFLPKRIQYYVAHLGIKLGIIKRYGVLEIVATYPDGSRKRVRGYNIIVDDGIKRLGDILSGAETTNTQIKYIEYGTSSTTPTISDNGVTTPVTGTGSGRRLVDTQTRNSVSPYDVVVSDFIASGELTRDVTIAEMAIYFESTGTNCFAHGILATPITLTTGTTATGSYGVVFR